MKLMWELRFDRDRFVQRGKCLRDRSGADHSGDNDLILLDYLFDRLFWRSNVS